MTTTLQLSNWKCHTSLKLDLRGGEGEARAVDVVLGLNGKGKSALVEAIEFVLLGTGALAGIHTKADLGLLAISDDADECSVTLAFEPDSIPHRGLSVHRQGWSVRRAMKRDGKQTITLVQEGQPLVEGKLREQQAELNNWLGVDESAVRAVLDSRVLLEGPEKDRKAVLFGATGHEAGELEILMAFEKLSLTGDDIQQATQDVLRVGWRSAEGLAAERRAACGREVKELHKPEPNHSFRHAGLETGDESIDLRQCPLPALDRRRKNAEECVAEATRGEAIDIGHAEEALRSAKAQLERSQAEVVTLEGAASTRAIGQLQLDLSAAEDEESEAQVGFDACNTHRESLGQLGDSETIEKPEICPIIFGEFKCPVTKVRLDKHRRAVAEADEDRVDGIREADNQWNFANTRREDATEKRREAGQLFTTEQKRLQAIAVVNTRIEREEAAVTKAEDSLSKANESAASSGQRQFHQRRLRFCNETIEARKRYESALEAVEGFEEKKATLEDKRARADQIAQALKSTGIEATLLAKLTGPLTEKLNEIGSHVGEMRITGNLEIEMQWDGRWRRFQQLSESMRERMAIAVQHAVASLAGFPLLLIDRVDHLDPAGKVACIDALVSVANQYRAVLALATLQGEHPTAAIVDGVATWYLTGKEGKPAVARVE